MIAGAWQFNDYTYTAMTGGVKAVLTTPTPGSTLSSTTVTFGWTTGSGVSQYWLYVGTTGAGSNNVFSASTGTTTSATVSNLPSNGSTVYVRLHSLIAGAWQFNDYTYTAMTGGVKAVLTTPTPGSTLSSTTATFGWTTGSGVSQYWLYVGTTGAGSNNVFSASTGTTTSATVSNLPSNGSTVYVRLHSLIAGAWQFNDYTYTAMTGGVKAVLTTPTPGSTLPATTVTLGWTTGSGVSQYWLYVGTTGAGSNNVFSASTGTTTSATVSNLPSDGSTVYVRLFSLIAGAWQFNDYTYTALTGGTKAVLTTPTPGSTLSSTTVTLGWTTGSGVSQYWLYVGTTGAGSNNVFSQSTGTTTSATVSSLPSDGSTVYVRLFSMIAGAWQFNDYTYTATTGGAKAVLTTPMPGSTLPARSVTFGWTSGSGVTQYWLYIGTTGPGSNNVFSASNGTAQTVTVSSLPNNGSTVYVRLFSMISGVWQFNDYTYTACTGCG